jgi:hypothetical protein
MDTPTNQDRNLHESMRDIPEQIRAAHCKMSGPEFIQAYSKLVDQLFLGSFVQTMERIQAGDMQAVEFALIFVEIRPYYFRSQYHRTQLIRMLKHTKLSPLQTERLSRVLEAEHDKKMQSPSHAMRKMLGDLREKRKQRTSDA